MLAVKALTNRERVEEIAAIFHLESMDIPEDEQRDLLRHLDAGTLEHSIRKLDVKYKAGVALF